MVTTEIEERPAVCPCCQGSGGHGYRPFASPSPGDDDEDCTNCGGKGTTYFTDAKPRSCTGYRILMRRVH